MTVKAARRNQREIAQRKLESALEAIDDARAELAEARDDWYEEFSGVGDWRVDAAERVLAKLPA